LEVNVFEFLKRKWQEGKVTTAELGIAVSKGWITEIQKQEIISA